MREYRILLCNALSRIHASHRRIVFQPQYTLQNAARDMTRFRPRAHLAVRIDEAFRSRQLGKRNMQSRSYSEQGNPGR